MSSVSEGLPTHDLEHATEAARQERVSSYSCCASSTNVCMCRMLWRHTTRQLCLIHYLTGQGEMHHTCCALLTLSCAKRCWTEIQHTCWPSSIPCVCRMPESGALHLLCLFSTSLCAKCHAEVTRTCCALSTPPYRQADASPSKRFRGLAVAAICCASSLQETYGLRDTPTHALPCVAAFARPLVQHDKGVSWHLQGQSKAHQQGIWHAPVLGHTT